MVKADDSIFASADYFKDVKPEDVAASTDQAVTEVDTGSLVDEMLYMDANDALGTTMAFMPRDLENLVSGVSTYGFSEAIIYYETVLWDLWMFFAEAQGTGMGVGIILASLTSRAIFAPLAIYAVSFSDYQPVNEKLCVAHSKRLA